MLRTLKRALSFHWSDALGLLVGFILVSNYSDVDLFDIVISIPSYILAFLLVFLVSSFIWLLGYHGELAYLKVAFKGFLKSYVRLVLAVLSTIGFYFFIRSFF